MSYTFTVDEDFKVIVAKDGIKIDEVGPWADSEGAEYWAGEMTKEYDANPNFAYPKEKPKRDAETL